MKRIFPHIKLPPPRGKPKIPEPQVFAYARVSTSEQRLDMQLDALKRSGVHPDNIYVDKLSGGSRRRPEFEKLLKAIRPGDTVRVWKMDRLGRRAIKLMELVARFHAENIKFESLTEPLDFSTPMGRFISTINAAQAQLEVELTAERTRSGIKASRERGNRYGRKIRFDLAGAIKHFRQHKNISAAAASVGVDYERFAYHVKKTPALAKLVKTKKRK
jgi:DNA invertase Pin-like site-specific DNA recombinase